MILHILELETSLKLVTQMEIMENAMNYICM